jgi:hypothetical protein
MSKKVVMDVVLKTDSAIDNAEELQESVQDVGKETKKTNADFSELSNSLDSLTGGAITKFKAFKGSINNVKKSFISWNTVIKASVLGLLITSVVALTKAFSASEEGQNRFAKILKQLGVVAGNIGDIFYSLGDTIYNVFTGNFDEASKAFETFQDRIKNFGKETQREIELAGELADKIAEANKKERELLVERAKTNVEINKLKTKAAEVDKFTTEQRISFLQKAAALEDEITGKEVELAKTRRDIKIQENSLSESTAEDLMEEAQLVEQVIRLEEGRLIRNKELLGVAAGLRKMEADKKAAERAAEITAFQKQQDTISGILKDSIVKNNDFAISAEQDVNGKLKGLLAKKADDDVKIEKLTTEQKLDLASQAFGNLTAILGEESKAGKAAAIAQTTIETYKGATAAYASLAGIPVVGPALGGIAAAAAVAAGLANVKAITSVGPPVSGPSVATPRGAQAPAFNVVGTSPESQLAGAINQKENTPVKAFVVSNEVTSAQSLERNIIEGATIG